MRAALRGEEYDEGTHALRTLIKAVTYHGLRVQRDGDRYMGRVLFDL